MDQIIIKLGGSVITRKESKKPFFNAKNVSRIAAEIASASNNRRFGLVIVHGAGSYGHPIASIHGLADGLSQENRIAMGECQALMNHLNSLVCMELSKNGIAAFPFQVSSSSVSSEKELVSINTNLIERLLKKGIVPVLYGTPAYDEAQGCAIISGDQIVAKLAMLLRPKKVIFATNVEGIFDKVGKGAKLLKNLDSSSIRRIEAGRGNGNDVTGGMRGKIKWILSMHNVTCQIVNGSRRGNVGKALSGDESIGTVVRL